MPRLPVRPALLAIPLCLLAAGTVRAADWPYAPNDRNCCQDNVLYAGVGDGAKQQPCTGEGGIGGRPFCGWNGYTYNCGTDGKGDPSGQYPYSCEHPTGCVPDCTGRTCGPDGCGGLCGTCADADVCGVDQVCHASECGEVTDAGCCVPSGLRKCTDKLLFTAECADCGWDPILGEYRCFAAGTPDPSGTHPYLCPGVTTCAPDCTGKVCGGDGCGTSCGTCTGGLECSGGQCRTPGPDSGAMADLVVQPGDPGAGTNDPGAVTNDSAGSTTDVGASSDPTAGGGSDGCNAGGTPGNALPALLFLAAVWIAAGRRRLAGR